MLVYLEQNSASMLKFFFVVSSLIYFLQLVKLKRASNNLLTRLGLTLFTFHQRVLSWGHQFIKGFSVFQKQTNHPCYKNVLSIWQRQFEKSFRSGKHFFSFFSMNFFDIFRGRMNKKEENIAFLRLLLRNKRQKAVLAILSIKYYNWP